MNAVERRFCDEYGLSDKSFLQLKRKVLAAAKLQTAAHNQNNKYVAIAAEKAVENVTAIARDNGINVRWDDGLYPSFIKGEHDRQFPLD